MNCIGGCALDNKLPIVWSFIFANLKIELAFFILFEYFKQNEEPHEKSYNKNDKRIIHNSNLKNKSLNPLACTQWDCI